MTVRELIKSLEKLHDDEVVFIKDYETSRPIDIVHGAEVWEMEFIRDVPKHGEFAVTELTTAIAIS